MRLMMFEDGGAASLGVVDGDEQYSLSLDAVMLINEAGQTDQAE